jgi:alkylation response protein AidB-like acyl-CoA dehydrogenase
VEEKKHVSGLAGTEIEQGWIARARALKPLLEAAAPRIEADCALPAEVLDALFEARLFRMLLPHTFGGAELEPATFFQVVSEIAAGDASAAWCISQSAGCSMSAAYMEPAAAHKVFGDARAAVAWGYSMGPQCRATPVVGGWRISGTWGFGSGNRHASWIGAHCHRTDEGGEILKDSDGRALERTMLIPRSSVTIKADSWNVVGLRGTGSDTYLVTDLFVPAEFSLVPRATARDHHLPDGAEPELEPERREQGPLYRFSPMNVYQAGFAAVGLGIARATLDAFIALAVKKTPSGTGNPLRDDQWIQSRIALSEAKLGSARAWIIAILREMWQEAGTGHPSFDSRARMRLASTYAIHEAREVVHASYADAGATAIFEGGPFERRLRDINAVSQQIQANFAHLQSVGQYYLGLKPGLRYI